MPESPNEAAQPACEKGFCGKQAYCAEAGVCLAVTTPPGQPTAGDH